MRNVSKFFAILLIAALLPITVWATENEKIGEGNWLVDQLEQQQKELEALQRQLQELQSRPQPTQPAARVYAPNVKLLSSPTMSAGKGETLEVELTIKNIGTSTAQSVLTQAESTDGPFSVEFLGNSNSTSSIGENAIQTMKMRIVTDDNAKSGTYQIKLTHSYRTQDKKNESTSDTLVLRITGAEIAPNVVLSAFRTDRSTHIPGGSFSLTVPIQNLGDAPARNVQITLGKEMDTKTVRLSTNTDLNNARFNAMAAGYTGTLQFIFDIDEKAQSGTYNIPFELKYRDEAGTQLEETFTYPLTLTVETESTSMEIRDMIAPEGLREVDQNGLFSFQVFNSGKVPANNITVKAVDYDETAIVPKSDSVIRVNNLAVNTGRMMTFSFAPTTRAASRSYTIGFLVEYEAGYDESGKPAKHELKQYASILVSNPDSEKDNDGADLTLKPRMIVSAYTVEPIIVSAGQNFDLNLTFQNASTVKAVTNIKVTIEAKESTERNNAVFTPVGGSNTFVIDHLNPKEEISKALKMFTVPDADPRTYKLDVTFDYQDEDYYKHNESEQIGINVKQTTRLEISSEPYFPPTVNMGQRVSMYFSIINSGRVSLSNVRVKVDGEFDVSEADYYVGNMGKGGNINYDGVIVPTAPGKQDGTITIFGEDATGDIVEVQYKFSFEVMDGDRDMLGDGDMAGMVIDGDGFGYIGGGRDVMMGDGMFKPDESGSTWLQRFWVLLVALGLTAVLAFTILIRHIIKNKNKAVDFDE